MLGWIPGEHLTCSHLEVHCVIRYNPKTVTPFFITIRYLQRKPYTKDSINSVHHWVSEASVYGVQVVCTQPRRAAAAQVAQRVAEQTHTQIGTTIGFCARFQDVLTPVRGPHQHIRSDTQPLSHSVQQRCSSSLHHEFRSRIFVTSCGKEERCGFETPYCAGSDASEVHDG